MKRESGASIVAIVLALAAVGAGAFAGYQYRELARARTELASAKSSLDQANAAASAAKQEAATARKELDDQKASMDQLRSERDSAKVLLEAEKAHSDRVRAELTLAQQQLAFVKSRQMPAQYAPPMIVRPVPIRIAPAPQQGSAIQGAHPAPVPR